MNRYDDKGEMVRFFSLKLIALLSVALVVNSAPAISANIPEITKSFPEINPIYVGLLTTIPSFFLSIGVFLTSVLEKYIGKKQTILTGLMIVGIFGTLPAWYQGSFAWLFLSRCLLGLGIGLFNRLLIQMISHVFQKDNQKKARALGLESACEGLGGIFMTLAVGQLVKMNWEISFIIYAFAMVSFLFVLLVIPNERLNTRPVEDKLDVSITKGRKLKSILLGGILFCIVLLFINYNLQITPLLIEQGIGNATNGSHMIAAIATGAFLAGNVFGITYRYLQRWLLPIATIIAGMSIFLTNLSTSAFFTLVCSLVLGFAFRHIMPYFMHTFTTGGEAVAKFGTTVVLVAYNLGATLAPYASQAITFFSGNQHASNQILITGILLGGIGLMLAFFNKKVTI